MFKYLLDLFVITITCVLVNYYVTKPENLWFSIIGSIIIAFIMKLLIDSKMKN